MFYLQINVVEESGETTHSQVLEFETEKQALEAQGTAFDAASEMETDN